MWVVLLVGCHVDGALTPKDAGAGFDTGTPIEETDSAAADETCNGLDDDGDGQVDEGYADQDGDGIADCVDPTCTDLEVAAAGTVPTVAACTSTQSVTPVAEAWATTVEWTWNGASAAEWGVFSGPVVAVTEDTDGDGVVTMADIPAVIVVTTLAGTPTASVVALDGATGTERWRYAGGNGFQQPAVADVDGDGIPEVLFLDWDGFVYAIRAPGELVWTSTEPVVSVYGSSIVNVADLEGDGTVEVVW